MKERIGRDCLLGQRANGVAELPVPRAQRSQQPFGQGVWEVSPCHVPEIQPLAQVTGPPDQVVLLPLAQVLDGIVAGAGPGDARFREDIPRIDIFLVQGLVVEGDCVDLRIGKRQASGDRKGLANLTAAGIVEDVLDGLGSERTRGVRGTTLGLLIDLRIEGCPRRGGYACHRCKRVISGRMLGDTHSQRTTTS